MLGYIRTHAPELRMRDYDCYRALYCGLCRHMGKCTGQCSRMTLSYDFVFLAAVRMALTKENPKVKKARCLVHPFKKRNTVYDSPTLRYCADASALLVYWKNRDDLADETGLRKTRAALLSPFLCGAYRRAKKRHPQLDGFIQQRLCALAEYEKNESAHCGADQPSALFGDLLSDILSYGLEGSAARIASAMGSAIGRWIYLVDAADDYEKDLKYHRFNPYRSLFGDRISQEEKENIRIALIGLLSQAESAYALSEPCPTAEIRAIIDNILYLGLPKCADRVLSIPSDTLIQEGTNA